MIGIEKNKTKILIEYAGKLIDEDFDSVKEEYDVYLVKKVGVEEVSRTVTFDDKELVITGVPDMVGALET